MTILEEVKSMQQQGTGEVDIIQKLTEEGYPPVDIENAINQTKIKAAVEEEYPQTPETSNSPANMQPSIVDAGQISQEPEPQPQANQPEYAPQDYYTPQAYPQQEYYQPQQGGIGADTMTEIAEQVVMEKLSEIRKNIGNIADFKITMDAKVSNIDERLKKIESIISQLQSSILRKVGDYGQAIQDVRSEMQEMQGSFSKLVNPLIDKSRASSNDMLEQARQITEKTKSAPVKEPEPELEEPKKEEISEDSQEESTSSKRDGFERYLR